MVSGFFFSLLLLLLFFCSREHLSCQGRGMFCFSLRLPLGFGSMIGAGSRCVVLVYGGLLEMLKWGLCLEVCTFGRMRF